MPSHAAQSSVLLLLLLLLLSHAATADKAKLNEPQPQLQKQQQRDAAQLCADDQYAPLYSRIPNDLRHWMPAGISSDLMDRTLRSHTTTRPGQKAIGVLFEGGRPYVLSNLTALHKLGHHAGLITAHLLFFQALGKRFGAQIPDVEFIVGTFDVPEVRLDTVPAGQQPAPLLRFCTSQHHADIPVPDIHFQMRRFNHSLISRVGEINAKYPWDSKRKVLFGRFSGYKRIINKGLPTLLRRGADLPNITGRGDTLCRDADVDILFCDVRVHLMAWAARLRKEGNKMLDVARQPRIEMLDHAGYRYLLHLDGQSCSSRLEQLLLMGSVVFKEDSGYHAFFHHLLTPHTHYLPVWKEGAGPEDVLQALDWAQGNDAEARAMAQSAQRVAVQFLDAHALTCYWYTLLVRLSALLQYKPGRQQRQYEFLVPVSEYLAGHGKKWIRKAGLEGMELP